MAEEVRIRLVAAALLMGVAVTHVLDLPDKLEEAPYMAVLFILLIVASLALMLLLMAGRAAPEVRAISGLVCALTVVGYVLSRTVGLPQIEDHVGQWGDPIGVASLVFEVGLVWLAVHVARARQVVVPDAGQAVAG